LNLPFYTNFFFEMTQKVSKIKKIKMKITNQKLLMKKIDFSIRKGYKSLLIIIIFVVFLMWGDFFVFFVIAHFLFLFLFFCLVEGKKGNRIEKKRRRVCQKGRSKKQKDKLESWFFVCYFRFLKLFFLTFWLFFYFWLSLFYFQFFFKLFDYFKIIFNSNRSNIESSEFFFLPILLLLILLFCFCFDFSGQKRNQNRV